MKLVAPDHKKTRSKGLDPPRLRISVPIIGLPYTRKKAGMSLFHADAPVRRGMDKGTKAPFWTGDGRVAEELEG